MTPATKLFLKLFAGLVLLFGACAALPAIAIADTIVGEQGIPVGILVSIPIVTGISLILALGFWGTKVYAVRKLGCALTTQNLKAAQEQTIIINCGYQEARVRSLAALQALPTIRFLRDSPDGVIDAHARMTWASSGQIIRVRLRRKSDDWTMITVSSRPKLAIDFADYGQNLANVRRLVGKLKEDLRGR
jgi:hypothetical protein